jgi:predicted N-acetyltransferase YhbS
MPELGDVRNRVVDHCYGYSYAHAPPMNTAATPSLPPLAAERPEDADAIERLVLRAFGPGRFAKAAERLREGRAPMLDLSVVAWDGEELVGCVRQWKVKVGETPAIFLGPIAVEIQYRSHGLGAALMKHACDAAVAAGHDRIVLVGDMPFFGPLGFSQAPHVVMPGPVDQRRVLARTLRAGVTPAFEGLVVAA